MKPRTDITGTRFGRLVVVAYDHSTSDHATWKCRCDCGKKRVVTQSHLRSGHTRSCGCLSVDRARATHTRHGRYQSKEYRAWIGIKVRCENPRSACYKNYGGRGISVCRRWAKFENFYADMGDKPFAGASLDRINNDGNYCKSNCRWATRIQQNNNTRRNVHITINGATHTVFEWLRIQGIKPATYYARVKSGWSRERAITSPVRKHRPYHHPSTAE